MNKRKKWLNPWLLTSAITLILIAGSFFYSFGWSVASWPYLLTEKELAHKNFLQDKKAILYFSTPAREGGINSGISYATFIDTEGKGKSLRMRGLESGSVTATSDQVLVEEGKKIRLIGCGAKEFPTAKYQATGGQTGYLKKNHLFYSIYNSGFGERGGYRSDVYWGNEKGFQKDVIPYFIPSFGEDQDREYIYALTMNPDENDAYALQQITLTNQGVKTKLLIQWEMPEDAGALSSIVMDEQNFYIVFYGAKSYSHVELMQINRKTYQRQLYPLVTYTNNDTDTIAKLAPLDLEPLYLFNKLLYYVDGFGDVYTFDPISKKVQKRFSFLDYKATGRANKERLCFRNSSLYFFRFNPRTDQYMIEKYNLLNGKREAMQPVTGIKEILSRSAVGSKHLGIYDFKILQDL